MDALIAHMKAQGWSEQPDGTITHEDEAIRGIIGIGDVGECGFRSWEAAITACITVASGGLTCCAGSCAGGPGH